MLQLVANWPFEPLGEADKQKCQRGGDFSKITLEQMQPSMQTPGKLVLKVMLSELNLEATFASQSHPMKQCQKNANSGTIDTLD